jgi:SAM-dependent methyltransferase
VVTARADAKLLGSFYTPDGLVRAVVEAVVTVEFVASRSGRPISVLDPACGDGRFLAAVTERVRSLDGEVVVHGVDIDPTAVRAARAALPGARIELADTLGRSWPTTHYDLVIGNPPFLSQLAEATTRGGASTRGGGPYADVAVEFLALGAELVDPDGGRLAFVLPQSLLASRDAAAIRARIDERAALVWSWWSAERVFDAQVHTCVVAFEFGRRGAETSAWSQVITRRRGVPDLPTDGVYDGQLGDRARLNANFRDEYYGLIPAVGDDLDGPPLVTSGLIDPGVSLWGRQPITFARRRWQQPRVDVDRLDPKMQQWARRRLVPKVLVANQTQIVEAVCDAKGDWLPGVPVIGVYPRGAHWDDEDRRSPSELAASAWEIAAVLTSGFASAWLWHRGAGTGLSANSVRLSPVVLAALPWPTGDLGPAVDALQRDDLRRCAVSVDLAYGLAEPLTAWWEPLLERIEARRAAMAEP